MQTAQAITVLNAITATNTPIAIPYADVERSTIEITSAGTFLNRSGVLTIGGSVDGTTYVPLNMIIPNVTNTNAQTLTRVAATTAISTTGQSAVYFLDNLHAFKFLKFTMTVTDGATPTGNFTVKLLKQYSKF